MRDCPSRAATRVGSGSRSRTKKRNWKKIIVYLNIRGPNVTFTQYVTLQNNYGLYFIKNLKFIDTEMSAY